jgi:hypothetical protein
MNSEDAKGTKMNLESRKAGKEDDMDQNNRQQMADAAVNQCWAPVRADNLPPLGEIVWLHDGHQSWIGGRDMVDSDFWLWGNTYGSVWHNGVKWDGDLETDDDYKPTHWMRLPDPPPAAS